MSRLTEKFVQMRALSFLKDYYKEKYELEKVFCKDEVCTTSMKRADGLICFNSKKQKEHTVSIEAKSHKTLRNLITSWNDYKFALHSILPSLVIGFLSLYFFQNMAWYFTALLSIALVLFMTFLISITLMVLESDKYKLIDVVTQIHQYPANEKWIAVSKDSLNLTQKLKHSNFQTKDNFENFVSVCQSQRIGLLIISRRKTEIENEPGFSKGDFLDSYILKNKIKRKINNE
ncbi:hypothetical protein [Acidiluteibacter ferrifornacis]|uniref:Uncharacterized protein n=1 Tax=Acidiluteibacter ferrifornacis TaxID=2692424 RepID=A0A6N9NSJ2_9FLAO|nr:hypothetical protein [Acidiluteibacter ferrifornacis]NBG67355.1 hypothetical protein [Acidiluteibacter ferrifornacis]